MARSPIRPRPSLSGDPAQALLVVHDRLVELEARENGRLRSESTDGSAAAGDSPTTVVLTSNVATASTSFVNVTGLSFPVRAGVRTRFRFVIPYDGSDVNFGSAWAINGPTASALHLVATWTRATGTSSVSYGSTYDNTSANSNTLATGNVAVIEGVVVTSAGGTVVARFLSGDASATITARAGASVDYLELS